ncbi:hypothetical protein J7E45_01315 [Microbacterium sp. ISL-59]|uniref:hypothetical protein n=1 Tax=Microbacterium sp. ISL-59 TaxID=2819159 RepID=UPI001BE90F44|nr:hypothetical protein [Microbacterium sp. ISL-59]MBT2494234.1 hypothetical protein [Microbacterium sp. ISL-59]
MTDKTASELAAEQLGFGETDPHDEMIGEVDALLAKRGEWSEEDRATARATLDRAKALPPRKPIPASEPAKPRPATASELAAEQLKGQHESAHRQSRGWR